MFKFLGSFQVVPYLPEKIEKLREIAYNLHWTWDHDAKELFKRVDRELWASTNHNPILLMGNVSQERLEDIAHDDGFISHLDRVYDNLQRYMIDNNWYKKNYPDYKELNIIYFSAEFGLTECLQTYSGGLGILAGDHLKGSSDLGLPLTGIGLLYKEGYFQQYLNTDGWQHERYEINDFDNLPMKLVKNKEDDPLILSVKMGGRDIFFQIWKIQVGRIPLYLLDTNINQNNAVDRKITETLYGGNIETRIKQEIVLGMGGIKTIYALGLKPIVCHMNEGHSAFLSLERICHLMKNDGLSFNEAKELGYYSNLFTTHTPVPAGIDVFPNDLVERYFGDFYRHELGISGREFYSLGTIYKGADPQSFNMAHLAMNTSGYVNGVSKLHREVSRKMWVSGFKNIPFNEIPIGSVTNGVHMSTHISKDMSDLILKYVGDKWFSNPSGNNIWERIDKIPDEELWRTHERRRERLIRFVRQRMIQQVRDMGGSQEEIKAASEVLNPKVLTIGFARRFATYKRASLIFKDPDKLEQILNNEKFPVQFIFAGKAHPQDEAGKKLIQEIYQYTKDERFKRKIVFIENYDMNVASYLVEGCDVWLNNPRRPLEASGTSGMKVIANGGLNFSVLDGWWVEGFSPEVGFKIGNGEEYADPEYQDELEARQFYHTLENQIVPIFYSRSDDGLQRNWITMVKNSMKKLGPDFNIHRMVLEYFTNYYHVAYKKRILLFGKEKEKVKELSIWKEKIRNNWDKINLTDTNTFKKLKALFVGDEFPIEVTIYLGDINPEDVDVQIYFGLLEKQDNLFLNSFLPMSFVEKDQNGSCRFRGTIICDRTGHIGFTIRVLPKHDLLTNPYELGLIYWAQ